MAPLCSDVYPASSPWLTSLLLIFSLLTTVAYASFFTNTVHLVGVYLFVLVLCVVVFVWNTASVVALYRTSLRTSVVLFALALALTIAIIATVVTLYVRDRDYMSHVEFIMFAVTIATSVVSAVLLIALIAVLTRFKPSPSAVCRPFRRTGKA